mmetsp:Transcript_32558/g.71644  ORF Transcript_32558/g.71644 Transcript_32558/m.71644 type:complete len:601 (-) Transcript_32558:577-2379(-)|eukprot:CAMPEP_0173189866 /NCGR_PEP_ID=MMETSP1141-20130122/12034_1 /TAXON_ID=483371 /ORGANISM="non described non described, Strain CCMP2298" /LENGTH=600 /DNA_ID=CAMNT_0014113925 /DNA_START=271 /DNA_END=2073 /DNA_ORIENTATION=+
MLFFWLCLVVTLVFAVKAEAGELEAGRQKIQKRTEDYARDKVQLPSRCLILYHVSLMGPRSEGSPDVPQNNLKMFVSAMEQHNPNSNHHGFYVFSVAGGAQNPLSQHLGFSFPDAIVLACSPTVSDLESHAHTLRLLGQEVLSQFGTVVFFNDDARGPFYLRSNGAWLGEFTSLLSARVGIVGAIVSCQGPPHVQTHAFAMKSSLAWEVLTHLSRHKSKHLEMSISQETLAAGHDMASIFDKRRHQRDAFNGYCTSINCVLPNQVLFMRWGGSVLAHNCKDTADATLNATIEIASAEPWFNPILPETLQGGFLYHLHKELDHEKWLDRSVVKWRPNPQAGTLRGEVEAAGTMRREVTERHAWREGGEKKVCLLVRTALMHGPAASNASHTEAMDLQGLMRSMLRQRNPNWEAFFFVTDDQPFLEELQATIRDAQDVRFRYLDIEERYRPKYTARDAGYTATDQALRQVQHLPQCYWLSITNADNVYGSEVFNNVLLHGKGTHANAYIAPMDSRNFAETAYFHKRIANGDGTDTWDQRCGFLEDELKKHRPGFAMTGTPRVGQIDLAGLFMERRRFVETNISFCKLHPVYSPPKYMLHSLL